MTHLKLFLLTPLFFIFSLGIASLMPLHAQVQDVSTSEVKGKVLSKSDSSLTLETNDGDKQVSIDGQISITRDGKPVGMEQIQPNDSVEVKQTTDGKVLGIESTSPDTATMNRTLMIAAAVGVLVALGILYAVSKSKKGFIKTAPTGA